MFLHRELGLALTWPIILMSVQKMSELANNFDVPVLNSGVRKSFELKCFGTRGEVPRILRRGTGELLDSHSTSIRNSNSSRLSHRLLFPSANDDNFKSRNTLLKTSVSFSQLKAATNRNFTAKFLFPSFSRIL